jgi:hypothetical protein
MREIRVRNEKRHKNNGKFCCIINFKKILTAIFAVKKKLTFKDIIVNFSCLFS